MSDNSENTLQRAVPAEPSFESADFLNQHIHSILDFYKPNVLAPEGFYHSFRDDGEVYDKATRHLVSSTRFVYNYATAYRHYGNPVHREWALHGLQHLLVRHRQPPGHFAWVLNDTEVSDDRAMCYGQAFVMLAASSCVKAGIDDESTAATLIDDIWNLLEIHFWEPASGAYADERDGSLKNLDPYRGQNANMHLCEAFLAAFDATQNDRYLDRAEQLVRRFSIDLAAASDGLIWEHYDAAWQVDMEYNRDRPNDLFKPWGFQPGHQVEWSKLLMLLNDFKPSGIWVTRAAELYDAALNQGWDEKYGGLVYGFAPDGSFCDGHKYFWVQAEAFAAAWRLYQHSGDQRYLDDYQRIWSWSWNHMIDHQEGAWFRIRNRDGSAVDDMKSPPAKTDYHTMGACWDVLSQQASTT